MQHKGKHFTEKKKRGRTTTDDEIDNDEITGEAVPQPVKDKDDKCAPFDEAYQTIMQMACIIHQKIFHKSAEYCYGCQAIYWETTEHIRKCIQMI